MTSLAIQWSGILIVAMVLSGVTYQHYQHHLATLSPLQVREQVSGQTVRVLGMVRGGTLAGQVASGDATFELIENGTIIPVQYHGPPPDNLRELKALVLIGTWNPSDHLFEARDIGLVTNYGFVVGAYLIGLVPLAMFLFAMSWRVRRLSAEMKASTRYQEE